jgi:hypothetical protein
MEELSLSANTPRQKDIQTSLSPQRRFRTLEPKEHAFIYLSGKKLPFENLQATA